MASSRRTHRYSHQLQHWLSEKFLTEVGDPNLRDVRILEVETSADLRLAKVHYILAESSRATPAQVLKAFERITPFLRRSMGRELELRSIPELKFFLDEGFEGRQRLAVALEMGRKFVENQPHSVGSGEVGL